MPSQPFNPLEPNPILAHAVRPARCLPLLISCLMYLGLAVLGYQWKSHQKVAHKAQLETHPERTFVIDLAKDLVESPRPKDAPGALGGARDEEKGMPPGTGTIDESLLKLKAIDTMPDPSLIPDKLLFEPPTPSMESFLGTKHLAVAKGGDGRPKGSVHGTGSGMGNGDGRGHGPFGKGSMALKGEDLDFVNYLKPEYPRLAVTAGVEGVVWVRVIITEDGQPLEVKALSGPGILIPNTLKAVMKWKFASLRRKGIHGTATVDVSVLFMLIEK